MPRKTIRGVSISYHGCTFTLPAGTPVVPVVDGMGKTEYAVRDVKTVMDLTGNTHDPKYRYCFVPSDCVEK